MLKEVKYRHYKNNKLYSITGVGLMQIDDAWIEAVIYRGLECGGTYIRSEEDFNLKFKVME